MAKKNTPSAKKLKFIGKSDIRHNDGVLIPGEVYDIETLKGSYLEGLIAQNYFEAADDSTNEQTKPTE